MIVGGKNSHKHRTEPTGSRQVTNPLYSSRDNQFYPELRSSLLRINCDPDGGMEIDQNFFVDLHDRPGGPARAHEVRLQGRLHHRDLPVDR